jgi:hypothetical protein
MSTDCIRSRDRWSVLALIGRSDNRAGAVDEGRLRRPEVEALRQPARGAEADGSVGVDGGVLLGLTEVSVFECGSRFERSHGAGTEMSGNQ